jgi:hypothetical protein
MLGERGKCSAVCVAICAEGLHSPRLSKSDTIDDLLNMYSAQIATHKFKFINLRLGRPKLTKIWEGGPVLARQKPIFFPGPCSLLQWLVGSIPKEPLLQREPPREFKDN